MRFRDRIVLVTGAASGIGRATAQRLSAEGATLILADVNHEGLQAVAATLAGPSRCIVFDAADPASCRALVAQAAEGGRLDLLCNIAGVLDWAPLAEFDEARWDRVIAINLSAVFHLCRAAMPLLVASRGNIVNMASAGGMVGIPYNTAYGASKAGVIALTKSLALEFAAAGVRVNAVCPTGVKTPMLAGGFPAGVDVALLMRNASKLDGGALLEPEDVAAAVAFLASDEAKKVTGIAFPVDGGQTAG